MTPVLPVDYWTNENDFLKTISTHKPFQFVSPDGATFLPASEDFVTGKLYYGTKLNDELRALGMAPAAEGHSFYVSNESEEKTYRHSRSGRHHLQLAALCVTGWRGLGAR